MERESLKDHIKGFVSIEDDELDLICGYFKPELWKKKDLLLKAGQLGSHHFFITKGCIRLFFVNEKGVEHTTQFAIENWWIGDYSSFYTQRPAEYYIQTVEASHTLSITFAQQERLLIAHPKMETYFRKILQRVHAASQYRIKNLFMLSKEEIYHQFCKKYPEFVQRIPQYLLASYFGFTPEYLSEIRKKRIS